MRISFGYRRAMLIGQTTAPLWQSAAQLQLHEGGVATQWLFFNQDSLTRRLTRMSGDRFSVQLLQEGWALLRADECQALGVAEDTEGWVREVYLCGRQQPWVFARSVASRQVLEDSMLDNAGLDLASQGARPLGERLFADNADNAFSRGELRACRYPAAWLPTGVRQPDLWARHSCFQRGTLAVLVAEVFLPAFWQALAVNASVP